MVKSLHWIYVYARNSSNVDAREERGCVVVQASFYQIPEFLLLRKYDCCLVPQRPASLPLLRRDPSTPWRFQLADKRLSGR